MKCVIFGGGGFVGSAIADRLLLDGHSLRIFEQPGIGPYRKFTGNERVEWRHGDLLSNADVAEAVTGMDAVIHLVSTTLPKNSNEDPVYDVSTNIVGTLLMLNAMVAANIRKIVFISSGGTVYGIPKYVPVNEKHPTDPLTSYGITKLAIEKYLRLFKHLHDIKPVILRVANPYGARQRVNTGQGVIGTFLYRALHDEPIQIWGNGSTMRDYVYVSDVADAFAKALDYEGDEIIFNIGAGRGVSLTQLVTQMESALGKALTVNYSPSRSFDVPENVLDIGRAKAILKWAPAVELDDGLAKTIVWMSSNV